MMRWYGMLLVIILGLFTCVPAATAQDARAILLSILHEGVEMRRVHTEAWLPLTPGAELPITEGDAVRTSESARLRITLLGAGEMLVLPNTTLEVQTLKTGAEGEIDVELVMQGVVVVDVRSPERFRSFALVADSLTVNRPASRFAVRALPGFPPSLIVAEGEAAGVVDGETVMVEAGYALRADHEPVRLEVPASFAHLDALLDGCPGVVNTTNSVDLRVRVGATTRYYSLGDYPDGATITLLGITEDGRWVRAQYLSGYGWVEWLALETDCTELRVYPNESVELLLRVPLPQADEIELLSPFFGQPEDDPWFYNLYPLS
jgi:hypothetical protein